MVLMYRVKPDVTAPDHNAAQTGLAIRGDLDRADVPSEWPASGCKTSITVPGPIPSLMRSSGITRDKVRLGVKTTLLQSTREDFERNRAAPGFLGPPPEFTPKKQGARRQLRKGIYALRDAARLFGATMEKYLTDHNDAMVLMSTDP